MDANTSNNSIGISSGGEAASDSDSTDYEPEPKKCKIENTVESQEGDSDLLQSNAVISVPIRASTSVVEYASQVNLAEDEDHDRIERTDNVEQGGRRQSVMTVGDLVQQTLEASLGPVPVRRRRQPPLPVNSQRRNGAAEIGMTQRVRRSTLWDAPMSSLTLDSSSAGDNSLVASETVQLDINRGSDPISQLSNRRRRRSRLTLGRGVLLENESSHNGSNNVGYSPSGSSSSRTSSECFTDDVDPLEIPSDEYLSPPFPTRQRRNAIFVRRDPPSIVQNEDDQYYHNELEVASVPDANENPIEDGSSTSGVDDEVIRRSQSPSEPIVVPREETDNNFADNENVGCEGDSEPEPLEPQPSVSSEHFSNSELSGQDKTLCTQCGAQSAQPFFRHCLRCFKIRRTWLPPRPASRRLKNRKALQRNSNSNLNSLNNSTNSRTTRSSDTSDGEDVVDGGPSRRSQSQPLNSLTTTPVEDHASSTRVRRSLPSSQPIDMNDGFLIDENNPSSNRLTPDSQPGNLTLMELFTAPIARCSNPTISTSTDVESQSQSQSGSSSQSQGSLFSLNSQNSCGTFSSNHSSSPPSQSQQSSSPLPNKTASDIVPSLSTQCSVCYVRDKDAAFVHNKIAHLYCCYTCADKILKKNGKCPICRERVLRVVRIINV